jgi:uncharacterized protein (DUF1800 family)
MARGSPQLEHLLRRAGFGATAEELRFYEDMSQSQAVGHLVDYDRVPDDVDTKIGQNAYVGVTGRSAPLAPNTNIEDARQRWLFRMVHSGRPLQEKMTLFWHNHFATAYSKVAAFAGPIVGTKMMALKPGELPGPAGQLELLREHATGTFQNLLIEVAKDPAMIVWLDQRTNTRQRPQENFGREVMELFTLGIGNYTEQDVYAAARVFTGWSIRVVRGADDASSYYAFVYNANQHEPAAKTFTFPVYPDGSRTIPARAATDGMQDGIDFLTALARHPETARRLARKLWNFFISDVVPPEAGFVNGVANVYLQRNTEIRPVLDYILRSSWFNLSIFRYTRYSWPAEYVARAIKEVGFNGFSVDAARTPLTNMGQTLFEPPDVNGWELGQGWFSTGGMLARMNFAATLTSNQRFNLQREGAVARSSPDQALTYFLDKLSPMTYDRAPYNELLSFLTAGGPWTGSDAQLLTKASGLVRLIVGSSEYQFV